ncbi:MAG: AsnC family transcriptional regulator [Alteromonadaceae bacterium]|uniref:Lrp/AsnC family transcriptional regulator n=1 Tax=unclassified Marinobacter TaxID=83889 RepID=UPI000C3BF708|nr:Lrp/AsnC family transcriptional regulator [Marinobacter sp. BGYM27]MAA64354.1 AsnC family transcriptional regulator [Alteromonadaceae bacterium]MBH84379.1 AsnC family transcriptional regulator [Alteromonadaceae bacterium]MDG5498427.1 Lrp/AsnC family transcriptional regulator [Marinobacter sp. BGYM27]|tara:strand:- start:2827 stop:3255 length:429 start_codon:yes stop_codon:yes gene_type:complete
MIKKQDQQLLFLLRQNARASISDLARELSLSRSTVQNRIARLEAAGIIRGYSLDVGGEYSANKVEAHVSIKVHQKLTAKTNIALEQIGQVVQLYSVSGEYDLLAIVQAQSLEELSAVLDDIGNLDGVERTNSAVVLETKFKR